MARVQRIKKSRVERRCHAGHAIPVGSAYSFAAPGYHGREIYACSAHPFRPSNLTTGLRAEALAAIESFEDAANEIDHDDHEALEQLETAFEEFKGEIESFRDQRQESLDAWEYGNSQLEELLDAAESAVSDLDGHQIEEWDGEESERDWDPDANLEPELVGEPDSETYQYGEDDPAYAEAMSVYEKKAATYVEWEEAQLAHDEAVESWRSHVAEQIETALELAGGWDI